MEPEDQIETAQVEGDLETEQPVEVEEQEAELTTTPPEGDAPEETEEPKKKGRFQERIDELVRDREEAKEEAANWRAEVQKLIKTQQTPDIPKIEVDMSDFPVPKRDHFDDEDDYQSALAERAAVKAYRTERAKDRQQETLHQRSEQERQLDNWKADGFKKFKDFDELVLRDPQVGGPAITPPMVQSLMVLENGHDIAYHLGKNPQESYRIARLHPVEQAIEIKNLAKRLSRAKPKTTSTAPSPTSPVGDREVVSSKKWNLYDPNIPYDEYKKLRAKEGW